MARAPGGPAPWRVVATGSVALTTAVVPIFLTGALSGRMGEELGYGSGATAAAIAATFAAMGVLAVPMARVTERVGPAAALRTGVSVSAACSLLVASVVSSWWQLVIVLVVSAAGVGLVDTGAARAFGDVVPDSRQGVAFGAKEASVPAASLAAGLSIPVLAGRLGWEAAFVAGAALAPVVWLLLPRLAHDRAVRHPRSRERGTRGPLVVFATGVALGCGAATAASTLLVPALGDRGWSEADAGVLLAAASACSIAVRLGAGVRGDHDPHGTWTLLGGLLLAGAAGAALLAGTTGRAPTVIGAVAVLGAGWGWTGLAFQTAVRVGRDRPAAAASIVLTGLSIGGAAGPAAFGGLAAASSYRTSWSGAAFAMVAGAVAILWSRRRLEARPVPPAAR